SRPKVPIPSRGCAARRRNGTARPPSTPAGSIRGPPDRTRRARPPRLAARLSANERCSARKTMSADRGMGEPISLGAALAAGKKVPPDVTNLLAEDHEVVLGWFDWYEQADDPKVRERVARRISMALRAHMAGEEEIFYPE